MEKESKQKWAIRIILFICLTVVIGFFMDEKYGLELFDSYSPGDTIIIFAISILVTFLVVFGWEKIIKRIIDRWF